MTEQEFRSKVSQMADEMRPQTIMQLRRIAAHVRANGGRDAHGNTGETFDKAADRLTMNEIQRATMSIRERTGDTSLCVRVCKGEFQLVSVVYGKRGKSAVTPKSAWIGLREILAFMASYVEA